MRSGCKKKKKENWQTVEGKLAWHLRVSMLWCERDMFLSLFKVDTFIFPVLFDFLCHKDLTQFMPSALFDPAKSFADVNVVIMKLFSFICHNLRLYFLKQNDRLLTIEFSHVTLSAMFCSPDYFGYHHNILVICIFKENNRQKKEARMHF